jgi:hypothetical protein
MQDGIASSVLLDLVQVSKRLAENSAVRDRCEKHLASVEFKA